ncbi:hypothetical protein AB0F81_09705 [Actinoplanes sp. NPDC024001]|uniref:hypothetical protein n=1 Tax=Actinoplanes sp. NPDC024001 TaxID=3154598 RepID=UPI0034098FA4
MTELAERFPLTIGPDGRVLLALALRRHPRASADRFARAQRYWACAPGGTKPRWLALANEHADDVRAAADAHEAAAAYVPGVACSACRDSHWKPVNRAAVTRYVATGVTAGCLSCHDPSSEAPPAAAPALDDLVPVQPLEARFLPSVTVRVDGAAAALLWSATGGDAEGMSSLVSDLVTRNFGIRRPGG